MTQPVDVNQILPAANQCWRSEHTSYVCIAAEGYAGAPSYQANLAIAQQKATQDAWYGTMPQGDQLDLNVLE